MENSTEVPQTIKLKLSSDPAISFPGMYPEEMKAGFQTDNCTPTVITPLITKPTGGREPRRPSTNEWISKISCIHKLENYSTFKKENWSYAPRRANPGRTEWAPASQLQCQDMGGTWLYNTEGWKPNILGGLVTKPIWKSFFFFLISETLPQTGIKRKWINLWKKVNNLFSYSVILSYVFKEKLWGKNHRKKQNRFQ